MEHINTTSEHSVLHTLESLVTTAGPTEAARRAGARLTSLIAAAGEDALLTIHWEPLRGGRLRVGIGAAGLTREDLAWAMDPVAVLRGTHRARRPASQSNLFSVEATPAADSANRRPVGFASDTSGAAAGASEPADFWSTGRVVEAEALTSAIADARATLFISARVCTPTERGALRANLLAAPGLDVHELPLHLSAPLAVSTLIAVPTDDVPARLKAAIAHALPHARFRRVGVLERPDATATWSSPLTLAHSLPASLAQALFLIPGAGPTDRIDALHVTEPVARALPMRHRNVRGASIVLGTAWAAGHPRTPVAITPGDARRHMQIVGQTGSGKSTAMATMAVAAAKAGHGLTFIDPHGATVDRLVRVLPDDALERTFLVRIADAEAPVRAAMWSGLGADDVEQSIAEIVALMYEMFDPGRTGIVGPRFERWFTLNAKANVSLLGPNASFSTIATLSSNPEATRKLARAIEEKDPDTAHALTAEYGRLGDREFAELLSWGASKVQRFSAHRAVREVFDAGANSLDFSQRIADNDIVLIDLGMPQLGAQASRIAGTLLLQQLWRAVTRRGVRPDPVDTHFLFLDEAHQFQHGPLPSMLAEGRKFGVGVTVAHQNLNQLVGDVRGALDANAGSLLAFRCGSAEAAGLAVRLGDVAATDLPRLPGLTAVASLCVDGSPTPACTLTLRHPAQLRDSVDSVLAHTHECLVAPWAEERAFTARDAERVLETALHRHSAAEPDHPPTPNAETRERMREARLRLAARQGQLSPQPHEDPCPALP